MGDVRNLLYGLGIGSFVIVVIILSLGNSNDYYGSSFDESNLDSYDKLEDINNISRDIRSNTNTSLSSNPLDVLGEFFKSGYSSIILTKTSIDIADDMSSEAIKDANIGESGEKFKILIGSLLVLFIMGAIISVAVGRDW